MKLITAESQRKADGLRLVKIRVGVVFNLDFLQAQLQNELLEAQSEVKKIIKIITFHSGLSLSLSQTKSLTSQLQLLQDTLNDTVSPTATSSSEVSLLEAPPPPDPRLRVLSVITLVSLAIALISTAFAYFF